MKYHHASYAVIGALLFATTSCNLAESLTPESTNVPLTPARSLAGVWVTTAAVPFFYQTDFCNGSKQTVSSATWNVTWTMTAVEGFTNVLDIEMRFTRSGSTPTASNCGGASGWVPLVSPTFFRATVSSSAIGASDTRQGINLSGSYTTSRLTTTWVHYECIIYCSGEYTATNTLQLSRQ